MYAAIGMEDEREVVCGFGETAQDAESDARRRAGQKGEDSFVVRVVPVGIEAARQIRGGQLNVAKLGL